jgi:hypothetical protein
MTYKRQPQHFPPAFPTLNNNSPVNNFVTTNNNQELVNKFGMPDNNGGFKFQNEETGRTVQVTPTFNGFNIQGDQAEVDKFKQEQMSGIGLIDWFVSFFR